MSTTVLLPLVPLCVSPSHPIPPPTPSLGISSLLGTSMQLGSGDMKDRGARDGTLPGDIITDTMKSPECVGKGCGTCLNGTEVLNELFGSG